MVEVSYNFALAIIHSYPGCKVAATQPFLGQTGSKMT